MWWGRVLLLLLLLAGGGAAQQEEGAKGGPGGGTAQPEEGAPKLGKVKVPITKTPKTVLEVRIKWYSKEFEYLVKGLLSNGFEAVYVWF